MIIHSNPYQSISYSKYVCRHLKWQIVSFRPSFDHSFKSLRMNFGIICFAYNFVGRTQDRSPTHPLHKHTVHTLLLRGFGFLGTSFCVHVWARAGHGTTLPRQRDQAIKMRLLCGYSIFTPRPQHFSYIWLSLKLCHVVALSRCRCRCREALLNCRVPSSAWWCLRLIVIHEFSHCVFFFVKFMLLFYYHNLAWIALSLQKTSSSSSNCQRTILKVRFHKLGIFCEFTNHFSWLSELFCGKCLLISQKITQK